MKPILNKLTFRRGFLILSWGLYDLSNQFFALNVVSLYFVRWLILEKGIPEIFYSIAFGISTFLIAVSAPILGVISDRVNKRKPFLIYLTLLSIIFTITLGITKNILMGLVFFAIANFGCQTAVVFYNALLINVAPQDKIGIVSGFGRMLGYTGALLAIYLIKPIVLRSGYQATFLPTGVLFLIFALPCLIFVKDKSAAKKNISPASDSYKFPGVPNFLKVSFFGLCVVNVIILFMSIYATKVFKLNDAQVINLIAFSTLFAILGSIISGYINDRIGSKATLISIYILWIISLIFGASVKGTNLCWLVGALVGTALGSIWVVLRALAIQLVPSERLGMVFGLFNLVGYISGIVGGLFWGLILLFLSPLGETGYRLALFSLNIFLLLGLIFLLHIPKTSTKSFYAR